mgnify:FL=1
MNRYVYIGSYIEKGEEKKIYYNAILDKFYAVPADFFDKQKDGLEYLDDLIPEDFEDPDIKPYEITNKSELQGLKSVVNFNARIDREDTKEKQNNASKKNIENGSKEKRKHHYKKAIAACYLMTLAYKPYEKEIKEHIDVLAESLENREATKARYLDKVTEAIKDNSTIADDIKILWTNDFTYLFNDELFITNSQVADITKRISEGDFQDVNSDNYILELSRVIFGDDYSIYVGLTNQLDDMANEKERIIPLDSNLFGYLSLGVQKELLKDTIIFGKDKYIEVLANTYGVSGDEIKELTDLLDRYYHSTGKLQDDYYSLYIEKLGNILIKYYKKKGILSEYEQFVLVSDIYNVGIYSAADVFKTVEINNNLFNDMVVVTVRDNVYGHYNLYFDSITHANITTAFYLEKLAELIKNKGENLDYQDPDSRFLVYLFTLSEKNTLRDEEKKELFTSTDACELADYITSSIFDTYDYIRMNPEFAYSYFSNGQINYDEMFSEINDVSRDTLSMAIFIEYERCLRHEVLDGNLSEEKYREQYEEILRKIALYNTELKKIVEDAINSEEPIFKSFNIPLKDSECIDEAIKKYTYQ